MTRLVLAELRTDNLGKRGEQVVRLFDESADILVARHCSKNRKTIVRQAHGLAANASGFDDIYIIDGANIYWIAKA